MTLGTGTRIYRRQSCPVQFCTPQIPHGPTWDVARPLDHKPLNINPLNAELNPIRHLIALVGARHIVHVSSIRVNPLNAELNPICHLIALVGAHRILHVSRVRVKYLLLFVK
jgi:hypothetical protein